MLPKNHPYHPYPYTHFVRLLSDEERILLDDASQTLRLSPGELLYREGERATMVFFVRSGIVKIYREGSSDRRHILRFMPEGEAFGYRAAIAGEDYVACAEAFTETELVCFPIEVLRRTMLRNPRVAIFFLECIAYELGVADRRVVDLTQKNLRGRLAETLLLLHEHFGTHPELQRLNIELSREDLACLANMTKCNAVRTLSAFAAEGIVEIDKRCITIVDLQQLEQAALKD